MDERNVPRGLLVAFALMLVFGATAAAGTGGQAARTRTLVEVRGSVAALAQDGHRIAWMKTASRCGSTVQILNLPTRRPVDVLAGSNCFPGGSPDAFVLAADGRVVWQRVTETANTYLTIGRWTASLRDPRIRALPGAALQISSDPDLDRPPLAMAADGRAILFYTRCEIGPICGRLQPGIYRLDGRRSRRLATITGPTGLAVSGRRFAVVTNSLRCCSSAPAWSHDGTRVAWIYHGNLWTVRADGTADRQLAAGLSPPYLPPDDAQRPSWSADDARLAFERRDRRGRPGVVYSVDTDGGGLRRLAAGTAPAWSPDGTRIAFVRGKGVFAIRPDGTGETRLTTAERATAGSLSWSPDSTRIAVSRAGDVYTVRADGTGETRLTSTGRPETQPAWSADGARIAYVDGSTIAIVNGDGTGTTSQTRASGRSPAWSPDSKRIAFVRMENGQGALWVMNADGSGQRRLIPGDRYADSPQWAPRGSTILIGDWYDPSVGNWPYRPGGIRLVSPDDGKARTIAPVPHSPVEIRDAITGRLITRFRIDGHAHATVLGSDYVASLVNHGRGVRVELYDLKGRLRRASAAASNVRNLSAAGRSVVFASGRVIHRLDARTGAVTTLATARRTPVGLTIEGRRVAWAENGRGTARIRAVAAP